MNVNKLSIILCILLWTYALCSTVELSGDHICHKQENYTETMNSTKSEPIQVRKNFWCIEKIRCSEMQSEFKEVVRVEVKFEEVTRSRVIKFCCPGYEEFETDGKKLCISNDTITTTTQINSFRKDKKTINNSQLSTEKKSISKLFGSEYEIKLPPSKIVHEPLPIPPLRPSLRKHKSVTFDESIDEVDEFNRRRTRSLPDATTCHVNKLQ
ncbi:hypothetical protein PVAND_005151 [Polypedilum vanderplanki]|uniref:EMI domain-containing protein n=1 Tax=Polypedilum vanderplanki TaxID=319348 RepID=A0A9J6C093_POLVA|nr:hypothetical protein PVAND_005151 [Polypedilum vanderplanki]